jgi:hypothetical protein
MPLSFLLDEHLRGPLNTAIQHHNARSTEVVDAVRVGDPADLSLGATDPEILLWAERNNRIVVTHDSDTMILHWTRHLLRGHHCPGLFLVRRGAPRRELVDYLALAAHAGRADDFLDKIEHIA